MLTSFNGTLRRFGYLVRLEAREVAWTTSLVLALCLFLILGVAWFAHSQGFELVFEVHEAIRLSHPAFVGFLVILADVLSGGEERAARRVMASLPVASALVFVAKVLVALVAAVLIYAILCAVWGALAVLAGSTPDVQTLRRSWEEFSGVAAELLSGGALVIPLASAAATAFVAVVFRHALPATIAGWTTIGALIAFQFRAEVIDLGTRHLYFPQLLTDVASNPVTLLALLVGLAAASQLRGAASRSWFARSWRIGLVLGLCSGAAASALELRDWHRTSYRFLDPMAYVDGPSPLVTLDGQATVVDLLKDEYSTSWRIELATGAVERLKPGHRDRMFDDPFVSLFERGMTRRRLGIIEGRVLRDGEWHGRLTEESLSHCRGGPAVTVIAKFILPPRRRLPDIAFYLDPDDRLHRVDLSTGEDSVTEYTLTGSPRSMCIDEGGRWLTWTSSDLRFHAIEMESGRQTVFPAEDPADLPEGRPRVYGGWWMPSLGGKPVLRCFDGDGWPSHATIEDGQVVGLPLARRYWHLVDVDGERLVGLSEENGLYLLGRDCQEIAVLREPMPDALPKRP
jgi:hypothetical protein